MNFDKVEADKYRDIWCHMDYSSRSAVPFADTVAGMVGYGDTIIDIGCGDGATARALTDMGYLTFALDITTEQVRGIHPARVYCDPAWNTGLFDNVVDWVVSTDVLEHIPPEKVDDTIRELYRIGRKGQIHQIATFRGHTYLGHDVHLSVHPIEWWRAKFMEYNIGGQQIHIMERGV